jgi:hypothetical protein
MAFIFLPPSPPLNGLILAEEEGGIYTIGSERNDGVQRLS